MAILTPEEWDRFLSDHPQAHLLQTSAWGRLKSAFGWSAERVRSGPCAAQVLFRRLPGGFSFGYIPKGPVGEGWPAIWPEVDALCRRKKAIFLKVEPDGWEPLPGGFGEQNLPGFVPGMQEIQPRRTIVVDLAGGEGAVLERMKQKTRYNIRLAQKKEVVVEESSDLDAFHRLTLETGQRDGFGVHSGEYYRTAFEQFSPSGNCRLFLAKYQGQPLAGLMAFAHGRRAWYLYGASNDVERNRMPAYLVQWEAIRWAIQRGCAEYDLWGVPDFNEETLEAGFEHRSDGLWGVYRFKRGFGGELKRSLGSWDRVYRPALYRIYLWWAGRRAKAGAAA